MTGRDKLAFSIGALIIFWLGLRKKKKAKTAEDKTALRVLYFTSALHYHAVARYAFFSGFIPVCGNLFHHAIEMYLKGYFCESTDEDERKAMGHNLKKIWRRFKRDASDASLNRFDSVISDLDEHEGIRYPEKIAKLGMTGYITLTKGSVTEGVLTDKQPLPHYEITVDELDALSREIVAKSPINPQGLIAALNQFALDFLNRENKSPLM
jgi:hypothetical protein